MLNSVHIGRMIIFLREIKNDLKCGQLLLKPLNLQDVQNTTNVHSSGTCKIVTIWFICFIGSSCTHPGDIDHGTVLGNFTFYEDVLTFTCDPGHELVGETALECLANKTWNGTKPLCTSTYYITNIIILS